MKQIHEDLLQDFPAAQAYLAVHSLCLQGFGLPSVNSKIFQINQALSQIDRAAAHTAAATVR